MKSFGTFAIKSTVKCSSMCNCKFENMFNSWKQALTLEIIRRLLKKGVESWKQASSLENRRSFLKTGRLLRTQTAREACALYLWYCKQANHLRHVLSAHCFFWVTHHLSCIMRVSWTPSLLFHCNCSHLMHRSMWWSPSQRAAFVHHLRCKRHTLSIVFFKTNHLHGEQFSFVLLYALNE